MNELVTFCANGGKSHGKGYVDVPQGWRGKERRCSDEVNTSKKKTKRMGKKESKRDEGT
jgi:hypothetical protein